MSTSEIPTPLADLFAELPAAKENAPTPPAPLVDSRASAADAAPAPLVDSRAAGAAPAPLVDSRAARMETKEPKRSRGSRNQKPEKPEKREKPAKPSSRTPAAKPADDLRLSDYPIAHLLPPEVVAQGKVRTTRAVVIYLLVAVLVLAGAAIAGTHLIAQRAQSSLDDVQSQNASVLAQEAKYAPARTAQNKVKLAQAAQRVGAAGEIDWTSYFGKIQAVLPQGVTITQISGETSTPATAVSQDSAPLALGRGAVVTLTISAPDENAIADTLDKLKSLPGYAGAYPGAITQATDASATAPPAGASTGSWSAPITLSLNPDAFANRFVAETEK